MDHPRTSRRPTASRSAALLTLMLAVACAGEDEGAPADGDSAESAPVVAVPDFDLENATFIVTSAVDGDSELFLVEGRADTAWTRLTFSDGLDHDADWVPGRRSVVFHSNRAGGGEALELDLFLLDVPAGFADEETLRIRDGDAVRLTTTPGPDYLPAVGPAGSALAFVSQRPEGQESGLTQGHVYQLQLDAALAGTGTPVRRSLAPIGVSLPPRWTPDGSEILFVRRGSEGTQIRAIPASGQGERLIREDANFNYTPVMSPDGQWLAYTAEDSTAARVVLMRPDGTERRVVLDQGRHYVEGWTPDGSRLLLSAWNQEMQRVDAVVMPWDGSSPPERLFTGVDRPASGVALRVR